MGCPGGPWVPGPSQTELPTATPQGDGCCFVPSLQPLVHRHTDTQQPGAVREGRGGPGLFPGRGRSLLLTRLWLSWTRSLSEGLAKERPTSGVSPFAKDKVLEASAPSLLDLQGSCLFFFFLDSPVDISVGY